MTRQTYPMPTDAEFLDEALDYIDICTAHCTCTDGWHHLWAGLKACGMRRGVHAQAAQLREALSHAATGHGAGTAAQPHGALRHGQRVLIAGAADAGSWQVLRHLYAGLGARFTVMDRCPAPLVQIERIARGEARSGETADPDGPHVRTAVGDVADIQACLGDAQWDVILVHNTLILMDRPARARALASLRRALAPGGVVLCNARYVSARELANPAVAADEIDTITRRLGTTFAAHPAALAQVLPRVCAYITSQQASMRARPDRAGLHGEIIAAGFDIVRGYAEGSAYPSLASSHESQLALQAELLVLRLREERQDMSTGVPT